MTIKFSDITGGGIPYGDNAGRPTNPGIGKLYSNGEAGRLELYTVDGWSNIVQEVPGISSIAGVYNQSAGQGTFVVTGTNFASGCIATAIGTNSVETAATTTSFNSLVQVTATFTGLDPAYEPYDLKITNPSNLFGLTLDAFYINNSPIWQTAAGTLGTFEEQIAVSLSATATDSDSTITYSITAGSLPSGVTLNSSTGLISGTLPDVVSDTTYTFTVTASDGSNNIPRQFSITSIANLSPVWTTGSGNIATIYDSLRDSRTFTLASTDPENDTRTYALVSGSIPTGMTFNSNGTITGTADRVSTNTTYSFVASVSDRINTVTRSFSIDVMAPVVASFTTTGTNTWTAPTGVNSVKVLLVGAGGGGGNDRGYGPGGSGGGGGIVYHPSVAVTPGTSYTLVVGAGGQGGVANNQSGGPGCVTTGFGATVGGGGGGMSEHNGNCNQGSACNYAPTTSVSGLTVGATFTADGGSGGCSYGANGSGTTYTSNISGTSYTYGGINNGPSVYGGGGVRSNSAGGNGIVVVAY